ncbi:DNA topoisomerase [Lentinula raphanica]|nr:DNA topoisomerase [Lentinula raphanica]
MAKVLCVAEKPSISKSISQILSGGQYNTRNTASKFIKNYDFDYPQTRSRFTVTCVSGHLTERDFPDEYRKWTSCDPFTLFDIGPITRIPDKMKAIERNLFNEAKNAETLMIWTDCDREGEHIGSEIVAVCKRAKRNINVKRARFSAIIPQQIHNAAQHPVNLDQRLVDAVEARIILDLKIGAAFTRWQTLTLKAKFRQLDDIQLLSYGPCQYPTLGFVVSRFQDIQSFRPETFWYIYLSLVRPNPSQGADQETRFNWRRGHLFDQDIALVLYEHVLANPLAKVEKVLKKETKKFKPLPLTTVELQKAGSRLLKLAPKKVLDIAEKLYQNGFLSYPRTETDQYDPQFDFQSLIQKQTVDPAWGNFAQGLQQGGFHAPRRGKNDDKAHPPIHPTAHAGNLNGDEKRVYEYITRRFLASCSEDAIGNQTTVDVVCGDEKFYATGLTVIAKNYLEVYPYDKWVDNVLPEFVEGETFNPSVCELREGQTTKPSPLTEADLVALMDKNGIGTDATIAQHIQTIIDREYVIEHYEGATKYLMPSTLGLGLVEGYDKVEIVKNMTKPMLRRETERRMSRITQGNVSKHEMIAQCIEEYKEMYATVRMQLEEIAAAMRRTIEGNNVNDHDGRVDGAGAGNGDGDGGQGGGGNGGGGGGGGGGGRGNGGGGGNGSGGGRTGGGSHRGANRPDGTRSEGAVSKKSKPSTSDIIDIDSDEDISPPNPKPRSTTRTRPASKSTSNTLPTTSTKPGSRATSKYHGNQTLCDCGIPAISAVVTDGSASNGRSYWKCGATPESCNFFKFVDTLQPKASSSSAGPSSSTVTRSHSTAAPNESPRCECNKPAVTRTVVQDTPNHGRPFWTCEERSCRFFAWADEPLPTKNSNSTVPTKRGFSNSSSEPSRSCQCNERAIKLMCHKQNENNGREFWRCAKDEGRCKFFEWDDDPGSSRASGAQTSTECFKCQQPGHWASNCPNESSANKKPRKFGSSGGNYTSQQDQACFKCGKPGHYSNACTSSSDAPNTKSTSSRGGRGRSSGGRGSRGGRGGRGRGRGRSKTKSGLSIPGEIF